MDDHPDMLTDGTVTQLLKRLNQGEPSARGELWQLVYDRLHALAEVQMRGERRDHALQPTALLNEAYMRIANLQQYDWRDRSHFFSIVASAMRRILVDEARNRDAAKRGGGEQPVPLDTSQIMPRMRNEQLVELDDALRRLTELDERQARIVELRFFVGLSIKEVAEMLGVSERTVDGDWAMARTWLRRQFDNQG